MLIVNHFSTVTFLNLWGQFHLVGDISPPLKMREFIEKFAHNTLLTLANDPYTIYTLHALPVHGNSKGESFHKAL